MSHKIFIKEKEVLVSSWNRKQSETKTYIAPVWLGTTAANDNQWHNLTLTLDDDTRLTDV